eukprot:gene28316-37247_t
MCTLYAIKLITLILSWAKVAVVIYVFGAGIYLSSSLDVLHSFGSAFIHFGLSLIFLAILSGALIYPFKFGVERHNRFIMAAAFVLESIIFANLILIASQINSFTVSEFSKPLQSDCLKNTPQKYTADQCSAFYNSDRTAGLRLVWAYYFTGRSDRSKNQVLAQLQGASCCGFFPPMKCSANGASFPSVSSLEGVDPSLSARRVSCGQYPGYYPQQSDCTDYSDVVLRIVGGCKYDMGAGFCLENSVDSASFGCASLMEDYAVSKISPHVSVLMGASFFNFLFMVLSCCMWWKRKETDVFPEFGNEKLHSIRYSSVKYQFEVMPKRHLLQVQGFLPKVGEEESKEKAPHDGDSSSDGDPQEIFAAVEEGKGVESVVGQGGTAT